ncbi:MAG: hypothetical protein M0R73_09970 [Dehalococcoidia bacterium]|nr:hypothetical protein [Dehalococcoidia bacterium]
MRHPALFLAGALALGTLLAGCSADGDPTAATTSEAAQATATDEPTATDAPTATATPTTTVAATASPTDSTTATATATTEAAAGATRQAPIGGFVLPSLDIEVGTTVVWSNQDGVPHTATADDGSFDSGSIQGGTFSHRFEEAGTFSYFCAVHPDMTAEITVS